MHQCHKPVNNVCRPAQKLLGQNKGEEEEEESQEEPMFANLPSPFLTISFLTLNAPPTRHFRSFYMMMILYDNLQAEIIPLVS